ncbi:MAG: UDP-galactopyranose mutase [Treponema sp.]|jgi:UDP-galactopyranose mutase|nr:UDP-galactopyranose mutase [Treponema sp.]
MAYKYDYLIAGSGLYGSVFAERARAAGKKCIVVEKRNHIAGSLYTQEQEGIQVHCYGPHIFHTNNRDVWTYVNRFALFNHFINCPIANYKGQIFNLPFNMNTFNRMWGVVSPEEARAEIRRQRGDYDFENPRNLEEMALKLVGRDIYEKLIRGYTEKQWGRPCSELPPSIIKRLPVRFTYDNNYYEAEYQGIPKGGYTAMIQRMLEGIEIQQETDYLADKKPLDALAEYIVYTGPIDAYFGYCLGPLEYRSLRFETETLDQENFQGNAVVNYTDRETPFTRMIEHKHFEFGTQEKTVISREYSNEWQPGVDPYYPIGDEKNLTRYAAYRELADRERRVKFCGRLGTYRYYDMDQIVEQALRDS